MDNQPPEPDHWHNMPPVDLTPGLRELVPAFLVIWMVYGIAGSLLTSRTILRLMSQLEIGLALALILAVAGGLTAWFFVCHRPRMTLATGLKLRLTGLRWLPFAAIVGALLGWAAAYATRETASEETQMRVRNALGWSICISYLIIGPIGEEAFYRGLVLPVLVRRFGANAALAFLTVGRATWYAVNARNMVSIFVISFLAELALSLLRHFSRSLWPAIVCNWALTAAYYTLILSG